MVVHKYFEIILIHVNLQNILFLSQDYHKSLWQIHILNDRFNLTSVCLTPKRHFFNSNRLLDEVEKIHFLTVMNIINATLIRSSLFNTYKLCTPHPCSNFSLAVSQHEHFVYKGLLAFCLLYLCAHHYASPTYKLFTSTPGWIYK